MTWHKFPEEKPTKNKSYLVCVAYYSGTGYDICNYSTKKEKFYKYDSYYGNLYVDVIAWAEIEEFKEKQNN